jgi:hypothetical protein
LLGMVRYYKRTGLASPFVHIDRQGKIVEIVVKPGVDDSTIL